MRVRGPLVAWLVAATSAVAAGTESPDVRWQEYAAPVITMESGRQPFTHSRWVAADGQGLWLLLPQRLIRLTRPPSRVAESSDPAVRKLEEATGTTTVAAFALAPASEPQPDRVAAASRDVVWLIDSAAARLWKVVAGKLEGPWWIGEVIGAAEALPDGRLLVNTPAHDLFAFAIVGGHGVIEKRFGARRPSAIPALSKIANTYIPALLGGGRIVAAHEYEPIARIYAADGTFLSEVTLRSATVSRLVSEQRHFSTAVKLDKETCCVEAKNVRFAADVLPRPDTFAIRFGSSPILEEFDLGGALVGTHVPRRAKTSPVRYAGAAFLATGMLEVTDRDVVFHPFAARSSALAGMVLLGNGAAATDATISVQAVHGGLTTLRTDAKGRFRLVGPAPSTPAQVTVSAAGHLPQRREGTLAEIVARPFRLEPLPTQCVTVTARDGGAPVTRFRMALVRATATSAGVSKRGRQPKSRTRTGAVAWLHRGPRHGRRKSNPRVSPTMLQPLRRATRSMSCSIPRACCVSTCVTPPESPFPARKSRSSPHRSRSGPSVIGRPIVFSKVTTVVWRTSVDSERRRYGSSCVMPSTPASSAR